MTAIGMGMGLTYGMPNNGWNPLTVSGCLCYLTADAGITLNGSNVSQWSDQSGNGNHFTQPTAGKQPAFVTSGINSKNSVKADGVTAGMRLSCVNNMSALMGSATAGERIILAQLTVDGFGNPSSINWGTGDIGSFQEFSTDHKMYDGFATTARKNGSVAVTTGLLLSPYTQDIQSAAGNFTMLINGTTYFTTGTNTYGVNTNIPTLFSNGTNAAAPMLIRALLVYDHVLSSADRSYVLGGLT